MIPKPVKLTPDPDIQDWETAVARFKHLPRQTWVLNGVPQGETVAAHTVGVIFRAIVLAVQEEQPLLDAILYALLHDLPEVIVGDLTLGQKAALGEKSVANAEIAAWKQLLAVMPLPLYELAIDTLRNTDPAVKRLVATADQQDLDAMARRYGVDLR